MTWLSPDSHRSHKKKNRNHMLFIHTTDSRGCVSGLFMMCAYIILTLFVAISDRCLGYCVNNCFKHCFCGSAEPHDRAAARSADEASDSNQLMKTTQGLE